MLPRKFTSVFFSQEQLIWLAQKERWMLLNIVRFPGDVPSAIIKLDRLHKQILEIDKHELTRTLGGVKKTNYLRAREDQSLAMINKLLRTNHLEAAERHVVEPRPGREGAHINAAIEYAHERNAYVAKAREYLTELRSDILDSNFLGKDNETPDAVLKMTSAVLSVTRKSMMQVLQAYHHVVTLIEELSEQEGLEQSCQDFCERQAEKIRALRYLPLGQEDDQVNHPQASML